MTLARTKRNNYKLWNRGDNMANNTPTNLDEWTPTAWAYEALLKLGYTPQQVYAINRDRCTTNGRRAIE
tara:strand:- start:589 stop:795 length:207 start_codon:yes stop_codon:yes gene_type:complete